ncbi:patatin-like phospholipase family protein [Larkinella soli]|uniref:patatin-like phospholipase family protein n=1 Tax=Larkinella soli TaxID=1770527 RepID=UPI000FFB3886|nr:patatin-like phospholipase family protein [Larkinella soli]
MRAIHGSGGGTRLVGILEAAGVVLDSGFKPDAYTGVSASSYAFFPLAMDKRKEAKALVGEILHDMLGRMFDPSPVTRKGGISPAGIWNAVRGREYLGRQEKSLDLLRSIITEAEFKAWAADPARPECWTLAVDLITGAEVFTNLKDYDFETALKLVLASGSIPVFTKPVEIAIEGQRRLLVDGGLRSHIASMKWLETHATATTEMVSIYSRPKDYKDEKGEGWQLADVYAALTRTLDIMTIEVSKSDEWGEEVLCNRHGIGLRQIFLPSVMQSVYDTDPKRLEALRVMARQAAVEALGVKGEGV